MRHHATMLLFKTRTKEVYLLICYRNCCVSVHSIKKSIHPLDIQDDVPAHTSQLVLLENISLFYPDWNTLNSYASSIVKRTFNKPQYDNAYSFTRAVNKAFAESRRKHLKQPSELFRAQMETAMGCWSY